MNQKTKAIAAYVIGLLVLAIAETYPILSVLIGAIGWFLLADRIITAPTRREEEQ